MSNAAVLRELHRIHIQLGDLRERRDRGPKQIKAHETNVAKNEAEVADAKDATSQTPAEKNESKPADEAQLDKNEELERQ